MPDARPGSSDARSTGEFGGRGEGGSCVRPSDYINSLPVSSLDIEPPLSGLVVND
jgi:hypothetical protein